MTTKSPDHPEIWELSVQYIPLQTQPNRLGTAARLEDFDAFRTLRDFVAGDKVVNDPYYNEPSKIHEFRVKGSPSDPKICHIIKALEKLGWSPVFQNACTSDQWNHFYPMWRHIAECSKNESNWLLLADAGGDGGQILRLEGCDLTVITRPDWHKKGSHCLNVLWCEFAVSQKFKDSFEAAGLTGAVFRTITYVPAAPGYHPEIYPDKPLPPCNRIYWMDSSVIAPWSLSLRRFSSGHPHPLNHMILGHSNDSLVGLHGSVNVDNEGYQGKGFIYNRKDMQEMTGIDFMCMAEWMRERNGVWRAYHLVSQKFRKWAHQFGCRFRMAGVKLID